MTKYYAIIGKDVPDSLEKRKSTRPEHLARLEQLKLEGRLLLAGPFPAIDSADPYRRAGVYAEVIVRPFKPVLP